MSRSDKFWWLLWPTLIFHCFCSLACAATLATAATSTTLGNVNERRSQGATLHGNLPPVASPYVNVSNLLIKQATEVSAGQVFSRLATFTDTFGPRLSGSNELEVPLSYSQPPFLFVFSSPLLNCCCRLQSIMSSNN